MKRKSKTVTATLMQPTELFLEDVEQIYSTISETADSVSIENDDYEFESINDLQEIKSSSLTNLKFIGYQNEWPQFFLFINPNSIYIRIYNDEMHLLGTASKVKEIISVRQRRFPPSRVTLVFLWVIAVVTSLVGLVIKFATQNHNEIVYTLIATTWIINILLVVLVKIPKNKINLTYSKNMPSFWKRNLDKIITGVITSLLTLIISYLFGKTTGFIP